MTKKKLILTVVTISLLLSLLVFAQESRSPGVQKPESHLQPIEAEIAVKMHELELKNSELEVDRAEIEVGKFRMAVDAARERGDSHEIAYARADLKQAEIHVKMQKVQSEMAHLRIKLAKARLYHMQAALNEKPGKEPTYSHEKDRDEIHQTLRLYEQMFVSENLDVLDEIFHPMAMLCWQSENPHTLSLEDCRIDLRETFGRRNWSGVKIYDTQSEITDNVAKLTCKEIHSLEDVDFDDKYNVHITLVKSQGRWRILTKVTARQANKLSISDCSTGQWR